jgi:multidrug transporter EmrE-like cation transporter
MNTVVAWGLVAATVIGLALGQVLFKLAALRLNASNAESLVAWLNLPIVAAIVVYAASTVFWVSALRALPLHLAYPASALGFILVPILGHFVLHEPLTIRTLLGGAVIVVGVAIAAGSN